LLTSHRPAVASLLLSFSPALAPAATAPPLTISESAGRHTLALGSTAPFYSTTNPIQNPRTLSIPNSPAVLALWDEPSSGTLQHFYSLAPNGANASPAHPHSTTIHLRYADFDPINPALIPAVPASLSAPAQASLFIVQFLAPPLEQLTQVVTAAGAAVQAPLPDDSVIARMDARTAARIAALPFVRWVGPFHPAYKLDESIRAQLLIDPQNATPSKYSIQVFVRGPAMQQAVADRATALGGRINQLIPEGFRLEATLTPTQLVALAAMDEVLFAEPAGVPEPDMDIARQITGANRLQAVTNFTGQGVRGELLDGGVRATHVDFAAHPPVLHTTNTADTWHGSSTYGILFGDGTGNAQARGMLPSAQGIFGSYEVMTNRYLHTAELVDPAGPYRAVFQSNSWGNTLTLTYTTLSAQMDDIIFQDNLLICQSQSNAGGQYSRPEAWAKNIVSVGGIVHSDTLTRADDVWRGASTGPASDGRFKPDLAHFYDSVLTTTDTSDRAYTPDFSGTSAATPIVAGGFGLVFQMWAAGVFGNAVSGGDVFQERPRQSTARALMINAAYRYAFNQAAFLSRNTEGWGMPDVGRLYDERSRLFIVNGTDLLAPMQTRLYAMQADGRQPDLRVTLVYPDLPGNPASSQARINAISLRVTAPDGTVYYGNHGLDQGNVSTPGGAADNINAVQNVLLLNPQAGAWTVEVSGDQIVQDAYLATPAMDAEYALVVAGLRPRPAALQIGLPTGPPPSVPADRPSSMEVAITPGTEEIDPLSPALVYRASDQSFQTTPLIKFGQSDRFFAVLPPTVCAANLEFYVTATGRGGTVVCDPAAGLGTPYAPAVGRMAPMFSDDFSTDSGWTVSANGATQGVWVRAQAVPDPARNSPPQDADGSGLCLLTGRNSGETVLGGPTLAVSPPVDISGQADPQISYARWISSNASDQLVVHISGNDGATWSLVESVTGRGGWVTQTFHVTDVLMGSPGLVRLRFAVAGSGPGAATIAAVDSVRLLAMSCDPPCVGDFDGSGAVNVQDFLAFLSAFGADDPQADLNGDGVINLQDHFAFLAAYAAGCG
jgi:serine protease AprX